MDHLFKADRTGQLGAAESKKFYRVAENKCVQQLFLIDIKIKCKEKQGTPLNTLHFKNLITLITVGVCLYQPY